MQGCIRQMAIWGAGGSGTHFEGVSRRFSQMTGFLFFDRIDKIYKIRKLIGFIISHFSARRLSQMTLRL